jgi:hypothetical protein
LANAPTPGNLLVAIVGTGSSTASTITAPTGMGTWSSAINESTSPGQAIFYRLAVSGDGKTASVSSGSSTIGLQLCEFSGVDTLDDTNSATGTSGSPSTGSVTANHPNELLVAGSVIRVATTYDWTGSLFTEGADFQASTRTYSGAYRFVTTTGDYTATASTGSGLWRGQLVGFYEAATPTPTATATATATPTTAPPVQQSNCGSATGTDTVTATFANTPTEGDLLVAIVGTGATGGPSFNTPDGWTQAINEPLAPGQAMFYKMAGSSESKTVTATVSAATTTLALQIYEFSGVNTLERVASSTGSTNPASSGSVTTTHDYELLVSGMDIQSVTSFTWGNSFTEGCDYSVPSSGPIRSFSGGYRLVTSPGDYSATATVGIPTGWRGQIAAFYWTEPPTPTPTATYTPTATNTYTPTATATYTPTATNTPTPTNTYTPTPTNTPLPPSITLTKDV